MGKRLEALLCLLRSADNMLVYQAHLDRVKNLGVKPETYRCSAPDPIGGVPT